MIKNSSKPSDGYSESPSSRPMTLRQQLQDALGKSHPAEDTIYELCQEITREARSTALDDVYKVIPVTYRANPNYVERTADEWREEVAKIAAFVQDYDKELTHQPPKDEEK